MFGFIICKCENLVTNDSNEIIMLLLGALIAFISSVGIILIQKWIDKCGKIYLYYKFINVKIKQSPWGFYSEDSLTQTLIIPSVFELQNTTNTTRVIRDICLYLYDGEKLACKMRQIEYSTKNGNKSDEFGSVNNSYSFVLPPRSIQKTKCEFVLDISNTKTEKYKFNKIVLKYFDEKNKEKMYVLKTLENVWNNMPQKADEEWIIIK